MMQYYNKIERSFHPNERGLKNINTSLNNILIKIYILALGVLVKICLLGMIGLYHG